MENEEQLKKLLSYDFNAFVSEKSKLKDNIKKIRSELDKITNKNVPNDDKKTFLISYLITAINISNDIDYLTDWSRQTTLESLVRIFLENYSEYYMLAKSFNNPNEIKMEVNFLFFREIRRANLSLQRMIPSSISNKSEQIDGIRSGIKFLINRSFPTQISNINESSNENFVASVYDILTTLSNDSTQIDKSRIDLAKRDKGSFFIATAVNANPIWGTNGYAGIENLYGALSESIHANLMATLQNSQSNGKFSYITDNPNIVPLLHLLSSSLDFMENLLVGLEL